MSTTPVVTHTTYPCGGYTVHTHTSTLGEKITKFRIEIHGFGEPVVWESQYEGVCHAWCVYFGTAMVDTHKVDSTKSDPMAEMYVLENNAAIRECLLSARVILTDTLLGLPQKWYNSYMRVMQAADRPATLRTLCELSPVGDSKEARRVAMYLMQE
jgi:hypothetical protein